MAHAFDAKYSCNTLLGRDFLIKVRIILDFEHNLICWLDHQIAMMPVVQWKSGEMMAVDNYLGLYNDESEEEEEDNPNFFTSDINIPNMKIYQKRKLLLKLGQYPHKKIHLEVDSRYESVYSRVYSVPNVHKATFKKKPYHLMKIGVLKPCRPTQLPVGTFIIPKKDGRV
eukprot:11711537-Ditylum_brightwellii.AAC.1